MPERANARTAEHPNGRTPERPITRQSYNVYTDQHKALQQRELEGTIAGKKISISEMVREALAAYLEMKVTRTGEHPNTGTPEQANG